MKKKWKKICLSCSISQEPYIIWFSFMIHICKTIISPGIFFIFSKIWFSGSSGGSKSKKWPKMTTNSVLHVIFQDPWIISSSFIVDMCKRIIFPDIFFSIFEMAKNDPKWKKLCCIPSQELYIIRLSFLVHMCKMMISRGIFSF